MRWSSGGEIWSHLVCSGLAGVERILCLGAWTSSHGTHVVWVCLHWQATKFLLKVTVKTVVLWKRHKRKEATALTVFLPLLETLQTPVRWLPALTSETVVGSGTEEEGGMGTGWGGASPVVNWGPTRQQTRAGWVCGWRAGLNDSKGQGRTVLSNRLSQKLITKKVKEKKVQIQRS